MINYAALTDAFRIQMMDALHDARDTRGRRLSYRIKLARVDHILSDLMGVSIEKIKNHQFSKTEKKGIAHAFAERGATEKRELLSIYDAIKNMSRAGLLKRVAEDIFFRQKLINKGLTQFMKKVRQANKHARGIRSLSKLKELSL